MKWSWRVGTIAGIGVYIHATFTLLIAWVLIAHFLSGDTPAGAVEGLTFILALFGCVLLHELGHALAARRFGIGTRDITLLPIGGVARLERMPERPGQELWVALAGPAVNAVIVGALLVWLYATRQLVPLNELGMATGPFAERLLAVNVLLIVFNLLPAFPMDGGRVLRALLALKLPYARATRIAATIGQVMAAVFVALGIFGNPFLLLIGVFVWIGAAQEAAHAQAKATMRGYRAEDAMLRNFRPLTTTDTAAMAFALLWTRGQRYFVVTEGTKVVGTASADELATALSAGRGHWPVSEVMQREFQSVAAETPLGEAFAKLSQTPNAILPVRRGGALVGLLTLDGVMEFLRYARTLEAPGGRPRFVLPARPPQPA